MLVRPAARVYRTWIVDSRRWDHYLPRPTDIVAARIAAQDHRRFFKTHLPFDGLPIHDEVKYVHVARDGRDVCMSFHNQGSGFTPEMLDRLDRAGLEDESVGRP
jgi:aryl sulfotransferase